jgi:hypothetical protein
MVDPGTALVTVAAMMGLRPVVQDFLKRVAGPAGDELGEWIRESVHEYRTRNVAIIATRAAEILAERNSTPREIPLRTLLPLLEGAANEDQADLQERWAALLATAAAGEPDSVAPLYAHILSQLMPLDARLLAELSRSEAAGWPPDVAPQGGPVWPPRWGARSPELLTALDVADSERLEVSITTVRALGLVDTEPVVRSDSDISFFSDASELRLSPLGRRFVSACSHPTNRGG